MRNLLTICMAVVACLGATPGAWAANSPTPVPPVPIPVKPFATVSVPKTPLNFGEVPDSGGKRLTAKVVATVVANHPYRLAISFGGLTQGAGRPPIPASQMTVRINGIQVPIGTARVEIATGPVTPAGGVNVPITIDIQLKEALNCRAGRYGGSLTLSII